VSTHISAPPDAAGSGPILAREPAATNHAAAN